MSKKKNYQPEVDTLIEKYLKRLEADVQNKDSLLSSKETLKLVHQKGDYPYRKRMDEADYNELMDELQLELVKCQYWLLKTGKKVALVFEGRDAAGKGGTIQRFMMNLNPRHLNHVALAKPTAEEQTQWYFQRYAKHLPAAGEISFYDRSWYNRAGVERVMGYCNEEQYQRFMTAVPELESQWVDAGITVVKYWLSVSRLEQLRRFRKRQTSELRRWKLSPNDIDSLDKWDDYTTAIEAIFEKTSHEKSRWYEVKTDDKMRGRTECIRHFLSLMDYPDKNEKLINAIDKKIVITH